MPDTGGTLRKTTHKTLGHAPASIADYNTAFSPGTSLGNWYRGDCCLSTHGAGWSLFGFNDFFVSDGAGGVQAIPRRNSVLMVDTATGVVYWLSSGDQFPIPGSVTFPSPAAAPTTWCWLAGGWATSSSSAILLARRWGPVGALYDDLDVRVMGIAGITGASPTCTAVVTTDLDVSIAWAGPPIHDGDYVYIPGLRASTFSHHLCRHAYSATASDYATGWEYWTGTAWSTSIAAAGNITIASLPLRALTIEPWPEGYLATSKTFDLGPELNTLDIWPDIHAWWAPKITGPWKYVGMVYTPVNAMAADGWCSYNARYDYFPGAGAVAVWSLNRSNMSVADHSIYGPQLVPAIVPGGGHGSVSAAAAPPGSVTAQGAAVGRGPAVNVPLGSAEAANIRIGSGTATVARVGSASAGEG